MLIITAQIQFIEHHFVPVSLLVCFFIFVAVEILFIEHDSIEILVVIKVKVFFFAGVSAEIVFIVIQNILTLVLLVELTAHLGD